MDGPEPKGGRMAKKKFGVEAAAAAADQAGCPVEEARGSRVYDAHVGSDGCPFGDGVHFTDPKLPPPPSTVKT